MPFELSANGASPLRPAGALIAGYRAALTVGACFIAVSLLIGAIGLRGKKAVAS